MLEQILPSSSDATFFTLWSANLLFVCLFVGVLNLRQASLLLESHAFVMDAVFVLEWSCQNARLKPGCTFQH